MSEADLDWKSRRAIVFHRDRYVCQLCEKAPAEEVDHVWPRKWGGTDDIDNLQASCRECNRKKGGTPYLKDITHERAFWAAELFASRAATLSRDAVRWNAISEVLFFTEVELDPAEVYERCPGPPIEMLEEFWRDFRVDLGLAREEPEPYEAYGWITGMVGAA